MIAILCSVFFHFPSVRSFAAHKKALFLDPMPVGRVAMRPGLIDKNNESVIEGNFSSEHCEREDFFVAINCAICSKIALSKVGHRDTKNVLFALLTVMELLTIELCWVALGVLGQILLQCELSKKKGLLKHAENCVVRHVHVLLTVEL